MIKLFLLYLITSLLLGNADHSDHVYDTWAGPGLHLMMCDNGTPDNYDDDFVCDWEDNREVVVFVFDK